MIGFNSLTLPCQRDLCPIKVVTSTSHDNDKKQNENSSIFLFCSLIFNGDGLRGEDKSDKFVAGRGHRI